MNILEDKSSLLEAINDYELYSKGQRNLLCAFVTMSSDGSISMSISSISKLVGVTRAMTYINLDALEKDGVIQKMNVKRARVNTFNLNYSKLNYILEYYLRKQQYILQKNT